MAKSKFCYRPDDESFANTSQRYTLRGWQSETDFNNKISSPVLYDFNNTKIYSDLNVFAHYEIEDAAQVASNSEYFIVSNAQLALKSEYKNLL
jgi:hypothetical protein